MRLPGTRYQEHGWEQVRKLLGRCSLQAFRQLDMRLLDLPSQHGALLDAYVDAVAAALRAGERSGRAEARGNSYGDSVCELALSLVFELHAHPGCWDAFVATLVAEQARGGACPPAPAADAALRKKVNDMFAGLRDKVDADNYIVATGRDRTPNRMYTYRMLDTAWHELEQLLANWDQHGEQLGHILGAAVDGMPVQARQARSIADCRAEWIIRWSESRERFGGSPGPLHTRSKRFSSLKNSPDKIAAMLAEIGDYEQLSANLDRGDTSQADAGEAALWLEDYWRVLGDSEAQEATDADEDDDGVPDVVDQILAAPEAEEDEDACDLIAAAGPDGDDADPADDVAARFDIPAAADADDDAGVAPGGTAANEAALRASQATEQAIAAGLSLPPRYLELARAAQDAASWTLHVLRDESLAIRLAVYHKLLGAVDDSYPDAWLDPASGALPTLQQLAALDRISMPTLRKRRNEAIDKLYAANGRAAQ